MNGTLRVLNKDLAEGDSRAPHYGKDLGEVRCVVAPASEGRKRPERPGDSETNPTTSTPAEGSDNTDTGLTPTGVMGNISAIRHTGHAGHPPL